MPQRIPTTTGSRRKRQAVLAAVLCVLAAAGIAGIVGTPTTPGATEAAPATATLTVKIEGVAGAKGKVLAAVCDRTTFLKRCAHLAQQTASAGVELTFDGMAPGTYAVMVFHDENGNGQFDKGPNGLPREGYGFSRNARGQFGPPSFDDAKIDVKAGASSVSIGLNY